MTGNQVLWSLAAAVALIAGVTDWQSRRIPNWLTVPAAVLGLILNTYLSKWAGAKSSLEGLALAMLVLFPFVALHAFGFGDWKLVGASGAVLGVERLWPVFFVAALVNAAIALGMVIWQGRLGQTLVNIGRILWAMARLQRPDPAISLENPETAKVPFGVAWALALVGCAGAKLWGSF
jgi:prepilin peptidase CpaA